MRQITAETKLFGLLGRGASFSLSPAMHNHAARIAHKDLVYLYFDIQPDYVQSFLETFWHMGGVGLNITMPYKNVVSRLVDCGGLQSVNTLTRADHGWRGHSTDGQGFIDGLLRSGQTISDFETVIVLGSGGAAQAVLNAVAKATSDRPPLVIVHRRGKDHDRSLLSSFAVNDSQILTLRDFKPDSVTDSLRQTTGGRRLIIQATSAPKNGDNLSAFRPILDEMTTDDFMVDLIYDQPSDLYVSAIARNLRCQDGLPMLIEQARRGQELWWGKPASYEDMLSAIKNSGWRNTLAPLPTGV